MLVHTFDKMSSDKQNAHLENANNFLNDLDIQNKLYAKD
jgi:ABC-type siderophore export system fused ATPase/permease subunit